MSPRLDTDEEAMRKIDISAGKDNPVSFSAA
jgi:hypothetical protein